MHVRLACPRPRLFAALAISFLVVWVVAGAIFLYGFVAFVGALPSCSTADRVSAGAPSARGDEHPTCRPAPSGTSTMRRQRPYGDSGFDDVRRPPTSPSEVGSSSAARSGRRR